MARNPRALGNWMDNASSFVYAARKLPYCRTYVERNAHLLLLLFSEAAYLLTSYCDHGADVVRNDKPNLPRCFQ